uniref:Uncharacterized protein n=1 Tax=Arundo donax TaxID=35708 RepID=A0A0A8ZDA5_ARUDO
MKTEDGGLGLAVITKFNLRLWAWETDAEGLTGWVLCNIVELDNFLPLEVLSLPLLNNRLGGKPPVKILGLVEDDDLVFIWTVVGVLRSSSGQCSSRRSLRLISVQLFIPTQAFPLQVLTSV